VKEQETMGHTTHLRRGLTITTSWDDGHPLDMRVAEALTKHRLQGTFYVPLRNSRPTISPAQIRELSDSFEIGAHTVNHVRLRGLAESQARQEIGDSKKWLEDILGKACLIFCFPGGSYAGIHVRMLRDAGFTAARTVELLSLKPPHAAHGIAIIPTTIQAYPHRAACYLRNAAKRLSIAALQNLFLGRRAESWPAFASLLLQRAVSLGGVFHVWGHSWEIEEAGQWQALDQTLAAMSECRKYASFVTNTELCHDVEKPEGDPRPALLSR